MFRRVAPGGLAPVSASEKVPVPVAFVSGKGVQAPFPGAEKVPVPLLPLLRLPQTWGIILGKSLTDPIWFFIADWFVIYLVARGIEVEKSFLFYWVPFLAADLGNFFGGGASSWLIRRGWPVVRARQAFVVFGGLGMSLLACTIFTANPWTLAALFGFSTFAYAAFCTMIIVLPSDLFPSGSVATVSGMSGTGAGLGTIVSTFTIGYVSDHYSFAPILIGASIIPLVAMVLMLVLIRSAGATGPQTPNSAFGSPTHASPLPRPGAT